MSFFRNILWSKFQSYIKFEDALVEQLCIDNIDVDNNNKISYKEAKLFIKKDKVIVERTEYYGSEFFATTDIVSFNEYKYFNDYGRLRGNFRGCSKLETIELSPNLETLDTYNYGVFEGCTSLKRIVFNSSFATWTNYNNGVFLGCTNIETIVIPSLEIYLKNSYCNPVYTPPVVNQDVPSWGGKASLYLAGDEVNALGSTSSPLIIPKSVTTLNKWALLNLSSVTNLHYEGTSAEWANVTLGDYCFYGLGTSTIHCDGDNVDVAITTTA